MGRATTLEKAAKRSPASRTVVPVVAQAVPSFWRWQWT